MRLVAAITLSLSLTACVQFPEIDAATDAAVLDTDYPDLVPLAPIRADQAASAPTLEEDRTQLAARARALQSRAARLRATAINGADGAGGAGEAE
ncbi:hypothetical protein [Roseobacter sp.]|uniref:hypothetical protein n=1 Tax=Roseobacter sp. TaxID=1907202 RepID=UPI0032970F2D